MRVMGVDPGSIKSGYGVVDAIGGQQLQALEFGVIRTPSKASLPERLLAINQRLRELIEKFQPNVVAIEDVFFAQNAKSALKLGQSRGAILLTVAQAGLEIAEYTPLEVKQSVVGYGRADKVQVQHMVKTLLSLQEIPRPDDAADALAIAICHHHSAKMRQQIDRAMKPLEKRKR
jgi:crossover junction endodeoxyribonuclease RuvC